MKRNLLLENATMTEIEEYFNKNNYNDFDFEEAEQQKDFALYAEDYQDADLFTLEKTKNNYNLFIQ